LLNARSIKNKLDDFQAEIIEQHSPSVVFVTETHLHSDLPNSLIDSNSTYNIFRKDRNSDSGGVLVMIRKEYTCATLVHRCFGNLDLVVVRARFGHNDVLFACFYRSSVRDVHVLKPLAEVIDYLLKFNLPLFLCGDFNLPGIKWNNTPRVTPTYKQDKFMDLFRSRGLYQHVTMPTRGSNTLDLIFTNEKHAVKNVTILPPLSATGDHDCVLFSLNIQGKTQQKYSVQKWNMMDVEAMKVALELTNWTEFFDGCQTCDDMWLEFKKFCLSLIGRHVPIHNIGSGWAKFPRHVRKALAKKKAAYKYRHCSEEHMEKYKQLTHHCKAVVAEHVLQSESKVLISPKNSKFYRYVNSKLSSKPSISGIVDQNGDLLYDDLTKAERFNDYYKSVFTCDDGRMIHIPVKCDFVCNDVLLTRKAVYDSIRKLPDGFASGPDGLPPHFYKKLAAQLAIPLHAIFLKSFETSVVPSEWRTATVTPVFKGKGNRSEPSSYRPISLTCVASKIMEKIVKEYISDHLADNNLITPHQHGFLRNKSTETQLLECFNMFTKVIDGKSCVDVYLDISKAFDTVCHSKLFHKLPKYGIEGKLLSWIRSFLSDRRQSVNINGKLSSYVSVSSGVPQGSVLGPLLFLIYINDIEDRLEYSQFKLFADDCKLYCECLQNNNFEEFVEDIENVFKWVDENQLKVAADKSSLLHLGRSNPCRNIAVNGVEISEADSVRDLGLIVRSDLKPSSHCEKLATKAFRVSNLIFRAFRCRNRDFLLAMFKVYVLSLFNHCSVLYNPYHIQDIKLLESVQRRYTKRIPGLRHKTYSQRLQELGLQTLERIRLDIDLCHCFKIIHGIEKLEFGDFFLFSSNRTRSNGRKLYKPRCRTDTRKYFFANRVVDPWNHLPETVVSSPSLSVFKNRLKRCDLSRFLKYDLS
jgi:hypothetical protein